MLWGWAEGDRLLTGSARGSEAPGAVIQPEVQESNILRHPSLFLGRVLPFPCMMRVVTAPLCLTLKHCTCQASLTFMGLMLLAEPTPLAVCALYALKLRFVKTDLVSVGVHLLAQPKAVFTFPIGELKAEEVEIDDDRAIALSGFLGGVLLNGQVVASYSDANATVKYTYKVNFVPLNCRSRSTWLYLISCAVCVSFYIC